MVLKCQEVPVFHPTLRDVNGSWEAYIESIERRFANVGLAKIIPPKGWTPRKQGYSDDFDFEITRPIRQHATGKRGLYRTLLVEQKPMSLAKDFRPIATEDDSLPPAKETPEEVERRFWRNITLRPPLYGADVPGSLFDADLKVSSTQCRSPVVDAVFYTYTKSVFTKSVQKALQEKIFCWDSAELCFSIRRNFKKISLLYHHDRANTSRT